MLVSKDNVKEMYILSSVILQTKINYVKESCDFALGFKGDSIYGKWRFLYVEQLTRHMTWVWNKFLQSVHLKLLDIIIVLYFVTSGKVTLLHCIMERELN